MATSLTVNGVVYAYPDTGDQSWGTAASAWSAAVTTGMLQKAGGTFTLTADVNFGASFGLLSKYFSSNAANPASTGVFRLASTDSISWRNNANGADIALGKNTSDQLTYAGTAFLSSAGVILPGGFPALTGDVTTTAGSFATTVASVGGSTAANVHAAEGLANAATNLNTINTIVKRDASGNFSAGSITATFIGGLTGNVTGNVSGTAATFTGSLTGDVTSTGMATTIGANKVTLGMHATLAGNSVIGNSTGSTATPTAVGLVSTATASTAVFRDSNANTQLNNTLHGYATTATGAGTTTLTVSSAYTQYFTGATTQTVVLPDATTVVLGHSFNIVNLSSGIVTVNKNGGTLVQTMAPSSYMIVTATNILSAAGAWTPSYSVNGAGGGTVTTASVVSANGFAGTVANATTTPAITITTTITGVLKGNATAISAATSGTDYAPGTAALGTGLLKSTTGTGVLSIATNTDLPVQTSSVIVDTGNGHGSTNTAIRRFTNIRKNTGTDITYADSATLGATFTINTAGVYALTYIDSRSTSTATFGVSINSAQLTTNISSITAANAIGFVQPVQQVAGCSYTIICAVNDVLRPHDNGASDDTSTASRFIITRVS